MIKHSLRDISMMRLVYCSLKVYLSTLGLYTSLPSDLEKTVYGGSYITVETAPGCAVETPEQARTKPRGLPASVAWWLYAVPMRQYKTRSSICQVHGCACAFMYIRVLVPGRMG